MENWEVKVAMGIEKAHIYCLTEFKGIVTFGKASGYKNVHSRGSFGRSSYINVNWWCGGEFVFYGYKARYIS